MDIITRRTNTPLAAALGAALIMLALLVAFTAPAMADAEEPADRAVTLAVGDHERRPIAPTQRDQLGLVLYGFMAVVTVVAIGTMRRQLKGERPQSDGEFRWR